MMASSFTIITDLGGVIVAVDKKPMCGKLAKHSSLSAEEIWSNFSRTKLTEFDLGFGKGLLTPHEFYKASVARLKLSGLSFGEFAKIYSDIFRRNEDTIRLLRKLGKRHAIVLLSNTDKLHFQRWSELLGRDMKLFRQMVLSFEVHAAKPSPKIYLEAVKMLGARPGECVYIDDINEYVEAARAVGMKGIRFLSAGQLETDLKELGLLF